MKKFTKVGVLVAMLAFSACGSKSDDAAKVASGLMGKGRTATFLANQPQVQSQALTVKNHLRELTNRAKHDAIVAYVNSVTPMDVQASAVCSTGDTSLSCLCSGSSTAIDPTVIDCSSSAVSSFTCKDTTYTMTSGSTFKLSFYSTSAALGITIDVGATVTGGDLDEEGTAIACHIGMVITGTETDLACDSAGVNIKCTVGTSEYDCDDMSDSFGDTDNACS